MAKIHAKQMGHPLAQLGMPHKIISDKPLDNLYINGRRSFLPLFDVECNAIAFIQGSKTRGIDPGVMDKYIRSILLLDEAIPLFFVKPFYSAICHSDVLLSCHTHGPQLQVATTHGLNPDERSAEAQPQSVSFCASADNLCLNLKQLIATTPEQRTTSTICYSAGPGIVVRIPPKF